ncbi:MAG: type II and III secretion system protein family protein [Xanthobacteraceae bacterium]
MTIRIKRRGGGTRHRPCSRTLRLAAITLAAVAALMSAVGQAQAQHVVQISGAKRTAMVEVPVGKSEDVRTDASFVDVIVGNPDIADVNPLTDRSLSILGRKPGTTRVSAYGEGKKLIGVFDVEVAYDTSVLSAEIRRRFPHAGLRVSSVNGRILLSGTAPDAVTVDLAMTIAKQFVPDVINSVEVLQAQQVMLEVRFVEISRTASRELGVQWNVFGSSTIVNTGSQLPASQLPITTPGGAFQQPGTTVGGANLVGNVPISPVVAGGVLSGTAPFGFLVSRLVGGANPIDVQLNALEQKGVARSLAEPNLVALSGDTASFLAGGEYPIPVPGSLGTVTIDFKKYGVGLAFTPTVLSRGLVNLKIEPEVSQLDTSHPVTIAGISVPPLIVRRASTTLELRDGQSFVLGGMLQTVGQNNLEQLPWLGDIPVLGALFRSASYLKNETDLVIIVTPHIVAPMRPGDMIKTPLDSTLPPNDPDFFLMGKTEITPTMARLAANADRPFVGHVLDMPKGQPHVMVRN